MAPVCGAIATPSSQFARVSGIRGVHWPCSAISRRSSAIRRIAGSRVIVIACSGDGTRAGFRRQAIGSGILAGQDYLIGDAFSIADTARAIRVGCAGWSLPVASGRFPDGGSHLERYAHAFPSVEINTSFYRPHRPATYARWAASVPEGFRFSVKMPKAISHELRLKDAGGALAQFVSEIEPLGAALGCLLLQLPPSLPFDPDIAELFFAELREYTAVRTVCEPRHASWFTDEARRALRNAGVGCVLADPSPIPGVVPSILYVRLHGSPRIYYSGYDDVFLKALASRLVDAARAGTAVWCVFDNTAGGEAVEDALRLMGFLSASS